ncbi:MAG: hypothetical protein GXO83_01725 [Chlorobi bacterium]|nr:hypothetical protein [Chlorobiota bacterium]
MLKFAHECFHLFQAEMRKDGIVNPFTDNYAGFNELSFPFDYDNEVIRSAMRLEAETIFNSIETDSLCAVPLSIPVRLFRHSQIVLQSVLSDSNKYKFKQWMEWSEGVAKYTEGKLALLIKDSADSALSDSFKRTFPDVDLSEVWEHNYKKWLNPIRFIGEGVRGRMMFYYSGMGKAIFLDQMGTGWKDGYFKYNLDYMILNR